MLMFWCRMSASVLDGAILHTCGSKTYVIFLNPYMLWRALTGCCDSKHPVFVARALSSWYPSSQHPSNNYWGQRMPMPTRSRRLSMRWCCSKTLPELEICWVAFLWPATLLHKQSQWLALQPASIKCCALHAVIRRLLRLGSSEQLGHRQTDVTLTKFPSNTN